MGCRERDRVPVASEFSDLSEIDNDWTQIFSDWQHPVEHLPHVERLLFSESGDLWASLFHDEFAHVHPQASGSWHPTFREWEVFDRDAVLVSHVTLPGAFDLRVIGDGEGFGFLTLDTGEVVVGRVDLTGSAVPPT